MPRYRLGPVGIELRPDSEMLLDLGRSQVNIEGKKEKDEKKLEQEGRRGRYLGEASPHIQGPPRLMLAGGPF
jgi:hypothetical protein